METNEETKTVENKFYQVIDQAGTVLTKPLTKREANKEKQALQHTYKEILFIRDVRK